MSDAATVGWRITVDIDAEAVTAVEAALAPVSDAVSAFEGANGRWRIDAFTAEAPDSAALDVSLAIAARACGADAPDLLIAPEPARDWVAETVRSFPPLNIGPFHLHGSHDEPASHRRERWPLLIDAGAAFGSGRHPSTAGCLLAIAGLAMARPEQVLDLGCGSGLLAIAMAKVWRRPVLAVDLDPNSVDTAAANASENRVTPWVRAVRANGFHSLVVRTAAPYDIIAANILARPLKGLAGNMAQYLAPGGRVILAGFVDADAMGVLGAYRARGFQLERRLSIEGWQTLVLRR